MYNLLTTQRPIPYSADGIGVWKTIISLFATVAVFSNTALLTYKTNLIKDYLVTNDDKNNETTIEVTQIVFFFTMCGACLLVMFLIRYAIPDVPAPVQEAIDRQAVYYSLFLFFCFFSLSMCMCTCVCVYVYVYVYVYVWVYCIHVCVYVCVSVCGEGGVSGMRCVRCVQCVQCVGCKANQIKKKIKKNQKL